MKRLLLDLNVILDVILDRPPGADPAAALWAAIEGGQGHGMIPAHGLTTVFYLLEKARGAMFARDGVERLIGVFGVAPVLLNQNHLALHTEARRARHMPVPPRADSVVV